MKNISAPYIANLYEYGSYHRIDENTLNANQELNKKYIQFKRLVSIGGIGSE